jgi:hypothetical protein
MTQKKPYLLYIGAVAVVLAFMYLLGAQTTRVGASVAVTNEYNATSTAGSSVFGAIVVTTAAGTVVKTGNGSLGSVIVTGANTGIVNIYDATTTNILARTRNTSTSSILITSLPASLAAGTYVFDINFDTALLLELNSGLMPTTTITYR